MKWLNLLVLSGFTAISPTLTLGQCSLDWMQLYNGSADLNDRAYATAVDQFSNVYVTGNGNEAIYVGQQDIFTIKYNSEGGQEWVAVYDGPGHGVDKANAIQVDQGGQVYVTGSSIGTTGHEEFTTLKYNSDGTLAWVGRYTSYSTYNSGGNAITLDENGNVYVTGGDQTPPWMSNSIDYITIKYNSAGVQQWVAYYSPNPQSGGLCTAIALDRHANVYVTGFLGPDYTERDIVTVKYSPQGQLRWVETYTGPGDGRDQPCGIGTDSAGNVVVAGYTQIAESNYDYVTIKYNTVGTRQWVAQYDGLAHAGDKACAVRIDHDDNIYVTGLSPGRPATMNDFATIKYNSLGRRQWVARFNGSENGHDGAYALDLDDSGNIYVTGAGHQTGLGFTDGITVKYDTNGREKWFAATQGTLHEEEGFESVSASADGGVYVAGYTDVIPGGPRNWNCMTVKYNQGYPLTLDLVPSNPPIQISPTGGRIEFTVVLSNPGTTPVTGDLWFLIKQPDGSWTGTGMGPSNFNLLPGHTITRRHTQIIAETFPSGISSFCGFAGNYYSMASVENCFSFSKLPIGTSSEVSDRVTTGKDSLSDQVFSPAPSTHSLVNASSNPSNPLVTIRYELLSASFVTVKIYNLVGQLISILSDGPQVAGPHEVKFDGSNLPSGIYLYRMTASEYINCGKMILMK